MSSNKQNFEITPSKKILFVCGCMEPGRDGVGDYTRRLAGQLRKIGCDTAIIAYYDRFTNVPLSTTQLGEDQEIPTLRLPANLSTQKRIHSSQQFVSNFLPDCISLQFVLYSFHDKGLPFGLEKQLNKIANDVPWHFMFHELWIGMDNSSSLKNKTLGSIQKRIINRLINALEPISIHSHTSLYIYKLSKLGISVEHLPLFSNIPVCDSDENGPKSESFDLLKKQINFILFGYIHPGAPINSFVNEMSYFAKKQNIKVTLTLIGRNGSEKIRWRNTWTEAGLEFKEIGEQSSEIISKKLANSDVGITTTPMLLVDKSGTVAAMRAHDLPILCLSKPWQVNNYVPNKRAKIRSYEKGMISQDFLQFCNEDTMRTVSLLNVATILLEQLNKSLSNG